MSIKQDEQIEFTFAGVPPFILPVGAPKVVNLDADLLDGQSSAFYRDASNMNSGVLPVARIADDGTPSASTYLRGDQKWMPLPGGAVMYDLKTSGVRVLDGFVVGYRITHNFGNVNYCVSFTNRRGATAYYQDYVTPNGVGQSVPAIIRVDIETNYVTFWFDFDIDDTNVSPSALAVGDIKVFLTKA